MRKLSLKELNRVNIAQFKDQPKTPLVLVLDNIRSALNVGAAFRTADAFSLEKIFLCGITAIPPHREILKTAIGATESVAWEHAEDVVELVQSLREDGYTILGVEQADQRTWLQDVRIDKTEKYALLFGNEVEGLDDRLMPLLDTCVEIPQFGTKHSLNISVCVGIVTWELFKQWRLE
ncbi:MAG TPA: RNA methyltransferase [Saprospiraceae bacterium]|nr:RNA methyltransferase [Saprospiraceae bacterium]HMQ83847.1 RNA methyltransferase [Saprospiraceae bacterium]